MKTTIGADAAKLAGLQMDFFAKFRQGEITLDHFYWFVNLRKSERDKFIGVKDIAIDPRYEFMKEFKITVPNDYDPKKQLAEFAKKYKKEFYYYNDDITDKNFSNPTYQLQPGKEYLIKIFGIKQRVTSEDNLNLLKSQRALLVGAQGASLVYQLKKDELPKGKWYTSFDEKDRLWKDADGNRRVPRVARLSVSDFGFYLGGFGNDWYGDYCLLCVCDC